MRLSKIKLAGFKSFVDPTTLNLVSNLSAVVGPNGCGKSNIIDAIRWVMGESSAKNLRGGALTDVIFNGTTSRKPIGQASVELVFDNSDGTLGGEYSGFSEIAIKRQVTRDGQSTYYLNGQRARRKDITGIFLGTGLGPRSYAIIEQGMIGRVIEAKPEDMRNFIEEASGVSKYKERRRETENRIKHTNENLHRVNDLRIELDKQLHNLEKQAEAARKFKQLKEQEKTLEAELVAMSFYRLKKDIQESEEIIRSLTIEIEKHHAELTHHKAELEAVREKQIERNDHLNNVQRQYYSIGTDIATIEQSIENIKTQIKALEESQSEETTTLMQAKQSLEADRASISKLEGELVEIKPKHESLNEEIQTLSLQYEQSEENLENWRDLNQDYQKTLHEATKAAETEKTTITHLEKQVQQNNQRFEKLNEEQNQIQPTQVDNIENLETNYNQLNLKQQQITNELDTKRQEQARVKENLAELKNVLKSKEKSRLKIKDELTTLQAMQAVKLGKTANHASEWLQEKGLENNKRLAELIQVESGWQQAVETLLADHLEAIYTEKNSLGALLQDLSVDNANLGLTFVTSSDSQVVTETNSILSKILNPEVLNDDLKTFLNQISICHDLNSGISQLEQIPNGNSMITQTGIWLGQGWVKLPAPKDEDHQSVLETERRIQTLSQDLAEIENEISQIEQNIELTEENLQNLNDLIEDQTEHFTSIKRDSFNLQSEIRIKRNKLEQAQKRQGQISEDMQEIGKQNQVLNQQIQTARTNLQNALDNMSDAHDQIETHQQDKDILEETRRNFKTDLSEAKEQFHQTELSTQAKQSELNALNHSIDRLDQQIDKAQERMSKIAQSLLDVKTPETDLNEKLEIALNQRLEAEEMLNVARDDVHACENEFRLIDGQMGQAQDKIESLRDDLENSKMTWQTHKVHYEAVQEKIEHIEINVEQTFKSLNEEADETLWAQNLEKLSKQIQRLGAINLTAIDEYSAAQERKTYLDEQYNDLTEALQTLEDAIEKIDQETRDRFQQTFDQINNGFKNLFPRLFGGGESSIVMTGEDILNTGVAVMAKPPGKKNATIQQLSGGEKALTAVAFVFSIFLLNPAPFCLLDEVDAPLDDSNVGRFCKLVKEMSEAVQFIFISHNKIAIEMAEQLHGVTMREAGVSRLVSVDIDEAVDMATA